MRWPGIRGRGEKICPSPLQDTALSGTGVVGLHASLNAAGFYAGDMARVIDALEALEA